MLWGKWKWTAKGEHKTGFGAGLGTDKRVSEQVSETKI